MTFSDIEDAFLFVGSAGYGEHSAILNKTTGEIYYSSIFSYSISTTLFLVPCVVGKKLRKR